MTVICAAIKNGVAAISSDTQTNFGSTIASAKHKKNSNKLFSVNGSVLGFTGWCAMADALEHMILTERKLFQLKSRMQIFTTFLELHAKLKKEYFVETKDGEEQPVESSQIDALIVNKHGLFEISGYREVSEYLTYWSIGSGRNVALGAMHALYSEKKTAKQIAEAGVRAAAEFDDGCGLPLNTRTMQMDNKKSGSIAT
ncbi:MAG: ATP-dependent HslUV protease subunit HslV [Parasphingorhabdus sp.]|jgi:ATP-dependent HslUV protease subunit HslV